MSEARKKQSIIVGALTGTAGIFLTKALGLLYASPFQAMAGSEMIFYTSTYQIYEFLLTISMSGIPFAIATLVAKYVAKEDYRTALMVRKLSTMFLAIFGVTIFAIVVLFSGNIVGYLAAGRDAVYLHKYQVSLIIVAFAIIAVPILSMFRGFYQGLKEVKVYAFTQVLEQLVRVTFLLGMGALFVYILKQEQIWAVYFAVLSTSVSAVAAIVYFVFFDKKHIPELKELASQQTDAPKEKKEVFKEILYFAIPYFLISIIGNCSGIINLMFVNKSLQAFGYTPEEADAVYSIMNFNSYKLVSIPQILGPGFAIAIIPHITTCLALNDMEGIRSNIKKVYSSCAFVGYPVILLMICYAPQVYYVMYGAYNLDLGADILRSNLCVSAIWIMMTLSSNTLMALEMKRFNLIWNVIDVTLLLIFVQPVVSRWGYHGMYGLYIVLYLMFIMMCAYLMKRKAQVRFTEILGLLLKVVVCLVGVYAVYKGFTYLPIDTMGYGRIMTIVLVSMQGVVEVIVYVLLAQLLGLPEAIFGIDVKALIGKVIHR